MFLNHNPPPLILYYCIKSGPNVKEEAEEPRRKTSHLRDALNLLSETDLPKYRANKCGLGKK
ncbi:hypothetical protein AXK38_00645 [Streptococcus mitis]|nr:hypothetical protein AXK38_00645 [Streptococcus mitis]